MTNAPAWVNEEAKSGLGRNGKYGLSKMQVHEVKAFSPEIHGGKSLNQFKGYLNSQGWLLGRKFKARQLEDGTIEVCRVE